MTLQNDFQVNVITCIWFIFWKKIIVSSVLLIKWIITELSRGFYTLYTHCMILYFSYTSTRRKKLYKFNTANSLNRICNWQHCSGVSRIRSEFWETIEIYNSMLQQHGSVLIQNGAPCCCNTEPVLRKPRNAYRVEFTPFFSPCKSRAECARTIFFIPSVS